MKKNSGQELTREGAGVGEGVASDGGQPKPIAQPSAAIAGTPAGVKGQVVPSDAAGTRPAGAEIAGGEQVVTPSGVSAEPVDLTQVEQFKKWQSERDKREAKLQSELAQLREQVSEQQLRADEQALENMSPEERAEFWEQRAKTLRQQQTEAQVQQQQQQQIDVAVATALQELGISIDDPALVWPQAGMAGALDIIAQAGKLALQRAQAAGNQTVTAAEAAARAAGQQALIAAGATKLVTGEGAVSTAQNPLQDIKDPSVLLEMAMGGGEKKT